MKSRSGSENLLKVARLFYEKGCSKTDIAYKLRVSVTQIARLLEEARKQGVVRFTFSPPRREAIAAQLREKFQCLKEAIVVSTESGYDLQTKTLAKTAAEYFDQKVKAGALVGLSGGFTIFEMVKCLPPRTRRIQLVPTAILGRGDTILTHIDPIVSLTLLWGKNGYPDDGVRFVTVTPLERDSDLRPLEPQEIQDELDSLLRRSRVRNVLERMRRADFIFASLRELEGFKQHTSLIGVNAADLVADFGITKAELQKEGAVGDVNYSFVDVHGKTRPEWRFFLGLQADDLREMSRDEARRIVVVAGSQKERILRAALAGELMNVLITDELTAESLLS